ncbi:MAG: ATP phosphoribosyltransferase [Pseudomonadota bacterium]
MESSPATSSKRLKIAVQKSGRLADASFHLLERCGLTFARSKDKLFCYGRNVPVDVLLVRDDDIPQLLVDGVCDLGVVGQNVAEEQRLMRTQRGEVADYGTLKQLDFGACRLSLAVPEMESFDGPQDLEGKRIATSYPGLTGHYLKQHGVNARIVRLSGSVEIAPSMGTADVITDLVSTGTTLRANHLREAEIIMKSTAVLLRSGQPLDASLEPVLNRLLARIDGVLEAQESKYVMLHAPKSRLDQIREILPGAESPTVLSLEGQDDRVAIHAVCRETVFWEHLEELKAAGASAVLVLPVEKMLA